MPTEADLTAIASRDERFDGQLFFGVTSTGIYCRVSCPAVRPRRDRIRTFRFAAQAQQQGFRACRRCAPDSAPGSPQWDVRADTVGRAVRLIADGEITKSGVAGLAQNLGYSPRHLNRQFVAELGVGPLAIARGERAKAARLLIEQTDLPFAEVAFAAGFGSIRQFNETISSVYGEPPSALRGSHRQVPNRDPILGMDPISDGTNPVDTQSPWSRVELKLAFRSPLDVAALIGFLGRRAVPGIESFDGGTYRRSVRLPHGDAVVGIRASDTGASYVLAEVLIADLRDLPSAVARLRRMLDLDADPIFIDSALAVEPEMARLVGLHPGLRVVRAMDPQEIAIRAVIGQQVSVAGARTIAGRLVLRYGRPLARPCGTITHVFPTSDVLAAADPADLPMPSSRKRTIHSLARSLADGSIDLGPGSDREAVQSQLLALHGIGLWTVSVIRMRALSDPDVFPASDLGVRKAMDRLELPATASSALEHSQRWRPWRSYATNHLWSSLEGAASQPKEKP